MPCSATTTGTGSFFSSSFGGMRMRIDRRSLLGRDAQPELAGPRRDVVRLRHLGQPLGPEDQPRSRDSRSPGPCLAPACVQERRPAARMSPVRSSSAGTARSAPLSSRPRRARTNFSTRDTPTILRRQHLAVGHDLGRQLEVRGRRAGYVLDRHLDRRGQRVERCFDRLAIADPSAEPAPFGASTSGL